MNTVNYIVNKLPAKRVFHSLSNSTIFSIQINSLAEFETMDLASLYSCEIDATDHCFFSFYFDLSEVPIPDQRDTIRKFKNRLLQFFFHPRFKRMNQKPVLFFKVSKGKELSMFISEIEQFCLQNGFDGLECIFPEEATIVSDRGRQCHVFEKKEKLIESYYQLLKVRFYTASVYTIKNLPEELLPEADNIINSCECKLREECNLQFSFMKSMNSLSEELAVLRSELRHSKEDLKNHQTYLEILKSRDETLKIYDFYYSEYEILPLWYKKFGHIIKVITGKRTFRSLFNNNVKK